MRMDVFNYGAGNLYSIQVALRKEGVETRLTKDGREMDAADAIVLPGVGSFNQAAKTLPMKKIRDSVRSGKPLLGICLGLQLFFSRSDEGPGRGLSLLPGEVRKLPATVKVPQIGWNTLKVERDSALVEGLGKDPWVYYVNSYYPETSGRWVVATSEYGKVFPTIVCEGSICGTQFHPEKSGETGRTILKNFLNMVKR